MTRFPDWPEKLAAFIESRRYVPFSWGSNDCALFWADAIHAMTGVDAGKPWRGYRSQRGAVSRIKSVGGMRGFAASAGFSEKPVLCASRGDGVLVDMEGRETFCVLASASHFCGPGRDGLVFESFPDAVDLGAVLAVFEV